LGTILGFYPNNNNTQRMGWTCYDAWCNMKQLIRVLIFTLLSVCTAETVLSTVRILITLENNKFSNEKSLLYMYVCKYNYLFPAIYSRSLPCMHACMHILSNVYIYPTSLIRSYKISILQEH
jgi:hypothetical protein